MATATASDNKVKISATKLLINNKWVESASGKRFKTVDQDVPHSPNDTNNLARLNGGMWPADDDLAEMSD